MSESTKQLFGLIQRPWGVFYLKNKITGAQTSLKTRERGEAQRLLHSKHAEVTVPSLDDLEQEWQKNPQRLAQPKLLPVDFRPPHTVPHDLTVDLSLAAIAPGV